MPAYYLMNEGTSNSTAGVWLRWSVNAATTNGSGMAETIWGGWVTSSSTTVINSTTADQVWLQWYAAPAREQPADVPVFLACPPPQPTEEERARREEERHERQRKAARAAVRAERLLKRQLSSEQLRQYVKDKSFRVLGGDGASYDIRPGWSGHVDRLDDQGHPVERFCIHPGVAVPIADNQLIAKLMLETDPERFKQTANRTRLRVEERVPG